MQTYIPRDEYNQEETSQQKYKSGLDDNKVLYYKYHYNLRFF